CRAKSADMPLMLGMTSTQFINYSVTMRVRLQNQIYYGGKTQIQAG
ncbi:hypothetical protein A2U01_0053951, partial [Trifolium medium]|nr:hypothetical protein [Trifolium medium]